MDRKSLEYVVPIQDEEKMNEINESLGTDFKSTDWHVDDLFNKINEMLQKCGDSGGWYVNDHIRVKIEVEYVQENK